MRSRSWCVAVAFALVTGCGSAAPSTTPDTGVPSGNGSDGGAGAGAGAGGGGAGAGGGGAGGGDAASGGSGGAAAGDGGSIDAGTPDVAETATPPDAPPETSQSCTVDAGGAATLVPGQSYGAYAVESISITGAPCGAYTLTVTDPMGDDVALRRADAPAVVAHAAYDWRMTVSATDPTQYQTFHFAGYFDVVVRKSGSGTINLYDLMTAIFDGTKVLIVP